MPRTPFRAVSFAVFGGMALAYLAAFPAAAQFGSIFGDPPRPPSNVPSRSDRPPPPPRQVAPPQQQQPLQPPPQQAVVPARPPASDIQSESLPAPPGSPPVEAAPEPAALPQPPATSPPGAPATRPRGAPPQPANTAPQPGDEIVTEMPSQKIANPTAVFSGLDKITGRITSFDVAINETVQFGALQVTPRVCYTRPPTETPNTDAFIEVNEVTLQGEVKRIFSGWTFAASPGLRGIEHPIYDIWLTDCKGATPAVAEAPPPAPPPARTTSPQQRPAQQRQPRPRQAQPPGMFPPPLR